MKAKRLFGVIFLFILVSMSIQAQIEMDSFKIYKSTDFDVVVKWISEKNGKPESIEDSEQNKEDKVFTELFGDSFVSDPNMHYRTATWKLDSNEKSTLELRYSKTVWKKENKISAELGFFITINSKVENEENTARGIYNKMYEDLKKQNGKVLKSDKMHSELSDFECYKWDTNGTIITLKIEYLKFPLMVHLNHWEVSCMEETKF